MPIEIKELVIKTTINDAPNGEQISEDCSTQLNEIRNDIIEECLMRMGDHLRALDAR